MDLDRLRNAAQQFVLYTDAMLAAAEQGRWEELLVVFAAREEQMALMITEAGETVLKQLPDLLDPFRDALRKNQRIELMMAARRDELGEDLSSVQQERRLRMTYR